MKYLQMLGKTQETLFYKLDWAQREYEMCPETMKKVGTEGQAGADAMGAQQNVGMKVRSLVLMANKNWGFDGGLKSRVKWVPQFIFWRSNNPTD